MSWSFNDSPTEGHTFNADLMGESVPEQPPEPEPDPED